MVLCIRKVSKINPLLLETFRDRARCERALNQSINRLKHREIHPFDQACEHTTRRIAILIAVRSNRVVALWSCRNRLNYANSRLTRCVEDDIRLCRELKLRDFLTLLRVIKAARIPDTDFNILAGMNRPRLIRDFKLLDEGYIQAADKAKHAGG